MKYKSLTLKFSVNVTKANVFIMHRIPDKDAQKAIPGDHVRINYTLNASGDSCFNEDFAKAIVVLFNGRDVGEKPRLVIDSEEKYYAQTQRTPV